MTDFLMLAFTFLVAGVIAVPIATRLGLGSVLGYLIAGIAISPALTVLGVDVIAIQHFAEFGVVMMLFLVGLELEPRALWAMRGRLLGLGGGQVGISAALIAAVALALGQPWTVALACGLVLSLSSTAIVLQTLNEKGLLKSDGGQSSFSVLLTQDIAVIPMLALLPLLAMPELMDGAGAAHGAEAHAVETHAAGDHGGEAHGADDHGDHGASFSLVEGLPGWQTALITLAAIAAVVVGGNLLTRPLFRFIAAANLRELFTATALLIVIGIALLMSLVGLSPALGTFLAGVVLASSEYRHELESDIDPFRGLLLGLFFMTVGASIDFGLLAEALLPTLALTLGLLALKAAVLYGLAVVFRLRGGDRWLMALGLAQAGEFGFVLLSFTVANAVLPQSVSDQLLLVIALSMLLTPVLFILYERVIAPRYIEAETREADEIDEQGDVLIAGFGRMGGVVDRIATAGGCTTTVIDYNAGRLERLRAFDIRAYYGDATRPDLLAAAGIAEARVFVIAIDDREKITELVRYTTKTFPDLHVIARAVDRDHVYDLWFAGCRDIIRENFDGSLRMGRSVFEAMGTPRETADEMIAVFNEMDRDAMVQVADVHDPAIPPHENPAYVARVRELRGDWEARLHERMQAIRRGRRQAEEPAREEDPREDDGGAAGEPVT